MTTATPDITSIAYMLHALADANVSVIPADWQTKRPAFSLLPRDAEGKAAWKPYTLEIASWEERQRWLDAGIRAYAVLGGAISQGLLILDFDEPEFFEQWVDRIGNRADGLPVQRTQSGAWQLWFRCPNPGPNEKLAWVPDDTQDSGRRCAIETRGEGGYALGPGAFGPSGNQYVAIGGDFLDIPMIGNDDKDFFFAKARELCQCPKSKQEIAAEQRAASATVKGDSYKFNGERSVIDEFNARHDIEAVLLDCGYTRHGSRFMRPNANEDSEPGVIICDVNGKRCSYHYSSNDPLDDRHAHTAFGVWCYYKHGDDVRRAVRSAAELMGMDRSHDTEKFGSAYQHQQSENKNPTPADGDKGTAADTPKFTFYTAPEFDALDLRRNYHIPGILAAGPVPTLLAGSFKTLKTSIAMDLLISLASGWRFLGHFPVSSTTRTAVMSGESGGFALQSLARRVASAKGSTLAAIGDHLRICTSVIDLSVRQDLDLIERFITENEISVLAVDPAYMAMRGMRSDDAGNLFVVGQFLEPLARIAERTGCTPLVIHHNSRGATRSNEGEPAELADVAWSGFSEWAGQWLLLARRERYDPDSDGEHRLWLTAGGRDGHSTLAGVNVTEGRQDDPGGRRWQVTVEQASHVRRSAVESAQQQKEQDREIRREKQRQQDRETIVAVLQSMPDGETKRAIRDRTGLRTDRFDPVFADMLRDGVVEPREVKKGNGRSYEGYVFIDALGRNGTHWDASGASR